MFENETKILVWCMGKRGEYFAEVISDYPIDNCKVIGYTDSRCSGGNFCGYPAYSLEEILDIKFDYVVTACDSSCIAEDIRGWVKNNLSKETKVVDYREVLKLARTQRVISKYKNSNNPEIVQVIKWLKKHNITVMNQWENTETVKYEVFYDESKDKFPYVNFKGKRMYYPKDYNFENLNGKQYITNIIECEQYQDSPHLYIDDLHRINEGDVIVDAGVAEGNFALSYIDMVSKAYLIESNTRWIEALQLTFAPYGDKVEIIPKMLSDEDTVDCITLDTLLQNNKVDFIKMDIEGAETRALLGGLNVLKRNDVRLSICTYHRKRDEEYVRFILESLGYSLTHTNGYMFFLYDSNIDKTLDFRRGVAYAQKKVERISGAL